MADEKKSKEQFVRELTEVRRRRARLEGLEVGHGEAEKALRESEERFRLIFDQSPIGAAIVSWTTILSVSTRRSAASWDTRRTSSQASPFGR